jgi:hypothetical protein
MDIVRKGWGGGGRGPKRKRLIKVDLIEKVRFDLT